MRACMRCQDRHGGCMRLCARGRAFAVKTGIAAAGICAARKDVSAYAYAQPPACTPPQAYLQAWLFVAGGNGRAGGHNRVHACPQTHMRATGGVACASDHHRVHACTGVPTDPDARHKWRCWCR
eukprot:362430-Chlamydomonas_euryale.AAC.9